MGTKAWFKPREAFPASDPVARWMAAVLLGWNDLNLRNARLLDGLQGNAPKHEVVHDARLVALSLWEIADFLRENDPAVRRAEREARAAKKGEKPGPPTSSEIELEKWINALPDEARRHYDAILAFLEPTNTGPSFKQLLVNARVYVAHIPELDDKPFQKALAQIGEQSQDLDQIDLDGRLIDFRVPMADELAAKLFMLPSESDPETMREELRRFVESLRDLVIEVASFVQLALAAYINRNRSVWTLSEDHPQSDLAGP